MTSINKRLFLRALFREIETSYLKEEPQAIDLSDYTQLIEELASKIQAGDLKPSDLDIRLVQQIYNDISKPVKQEFKDQWINYNYKEPGHLIQKFKKNLWKFSSAKTLAELEYINSLLIDKNGRIKPERKFKEEIREANILFNRNYLQAEYQTAKRGAQMAHLWARFQEQKHLYPNLVYRTVGDSRVRLEHEVLNGIVKPIDDPFWKTYYPPNGWRCRCTVMNTAQEITPGEFRDESIKPEFHGNTALDEEILTSKGSFFKLLNKDYKAKQNAELLKYNAPMDIAYHGRQKKKVWVSPFADEKDLIPNVETAMVMVDKLGIDVKIRAHINPTIIKNHKNPEYEINGRIADRKEQKGKNINSNLESAKKQGCKIIVFDISNEYPFTIDRFKQNLRGMLKKTYHKYFEKVIIVNGKDVEEIIVEDFIK